MPCVYSRPTVALSLLCVWVPIYHQVSNWQALLLESRRVFVIAPHFVDPFVRRRCLVETGVGVVRAPCGMCSAFVCVVCHMCVAVALMLLWLCRWWIELRQVRVVCVVLVQRNGLIFARVRFPTSACPSLLLQLLLDSLWRFCRCCVAVAVVCVRV